MDFAYPFCLKGRRKTFQVISKFTDFLQANGIWAATRPLPELSTTQVRTTYVPARTDGKKTQCQKTH